MPRVLDVGNCDLDHGSIRGLLEAHFQVEIVRCHSRDEALAALRASPVDLVLVNRVFDRDGYDGLSLIREIKRDPALARLPCMLITNFPQHAAAAEAAGALPGFGKASLHERATLERLAAVLGPTLPASAKHS